MNELNYSEYKSLVDLIKSDDIYNKYENLMKKENKVLDTVNHVIKNVKNIESQQNQIIHMSIYQIYNNMFLEIPKIMNELYRINNTNDIIIILTKNNRLIYLGIILVLISIFLFFIEISK